MASGGDVDVVSKLEKAISYACGILGYEKLRDFQKEGVAAVLKDQDVFVAKPTGSGKSLIFLFKLFVKVEMLHYNMDLNINQSITIIHLQTHLHCAMMVLFTDMFFCSMIWAGITRLSASLSFGTKVLRSHMISQVLKC